MSAVRLPLAAPLAGNCWIVTEGHAGMENQCIGLAEALGLAWQRRRVRHARWLRWLPLLPASHLVRLLAQEFGLQPPWPDAIVSCGRRAVPVALALRRLCAGRSLAVHIQNPYVSTAHFDYVVAPAHDGLMGANVIPTQGALHRLTAQRLAAAHAHFAPWFADLPARRLAVLIGGSTRHHRLQPMELAELARQLAACAQRHGLGLLITPSRRTGATNERALREGLRGVPAYIWDGCGENPYLGLIAHAEALVVTSDSITMLSEAASTGKPVHLYDLPVKSPRLRSFAHTLIAWGVARPFTGTLESWRYAPLNETARAAGLLRKCLPPRRLMGP